MFLKALGRVIRHKDDYGAIILVDQRYIEKPKQHTKGQKLTNDYLIKLFNIYFYSFILITVQVILNLIISTVVDTLSESRDNLELPVT